MKRIELYVDGQHLVIEECEGRAEIRHADQPKVMAGPRTTVQTGGYGLARDITGVARTVELKVELGE